MALLLITNPPTTLAVSSDWTDLVTRSSGNMLGHGLSIPIFTLNYWNSSATVPTVAEGAIIETGGSFYQADSDTALTLESGLTDGTVHIKLVPAGGGASVVPTITNDSIPTWDGNKAGWYDSDDKFLPYEMTKSGTSYTAKKEYIDQDADVNLDISTGGLNASRLSAGTVNTGQGDNELYDMNQNVTTTSAVTFSTVNTGQGNNELYDMNQNVTTGSDVAFATLSVAGNIMPTLRTQSTWNITTTAYVIPRGVYNIAWGLSASPAVRVQIHNGSVWETIAISSTSSGSAYGSAGCTVFADGYNVRIAAQASGTAVVSYQKY